MILIIDNNNNRASGLCASLTFVGEKVQLVEENASLPQVKDDQDGIIVILGALNRVDHEQLIKSNPAVPFLLIGETLRPF